MATVRTSAGLKDLLSLLHLGRVGGLSDGQLLDRFLARRDEAAELAFAVLVERHGPMVLRVCRGILRDAHDAQDAYQATFLVLVRRAASIRSKDSLASWLHGVACRVARTARSASARRRTHEQRCCVLGVHSPVQPGDLDLAPVLHEEIERLPARYRAAIVACHLQGLTHEQAAARLGWPVGTVRSRLARGRERLRVGLLERGVAPSAAVLGLALSQRTASAAFPSSLISTTARTALAGSTGQVLAPAVLKLARGAFPMLSIKTATAAVILALTAFGAAQVSRSTADRAHGAREDLRSEPEVAAPLAPPAIELEGRTVYDPDSLIRVRPRFEAVVEKTFVALGQSVKKGDPLLELRSTDLAAAKSDFQTKFVQWRHDRKLHELRESLFKTGAISQQLWDETQKNEQKSRLEYLLARDKLQVYEVPDEEIKRLEAGLRGKGDDRSRFTLVARTDGVVVECTAVPRNFYGTKDVLLVLASLDRLWVLADLPARFRDRVKLGQPVEVQSAALEEKIRGRLEQIDVSGFVNLDCVKIRATVANPGGRLKADMPVRLRIVVP
jgi:RNA polymerase sigma factor (sigma-70 family)